MVKRLWKNIDWTDKEEKKAFFNKYFNGKEFVNEEINKALTNFKTTLIRFIEHGEIKERGQKRKINNKDILQQIKKYI